MDNARKQSNIHHYVGNKQQELTDKTEQMIDQGKQYASELYQESVDKLNEAEEYLKGYSDEMLLKIQKNPMTSIIIAAGIGYLLSFLLRK